MAEEELEPGQGRHEDWPPEQPESMTSAPEEAEVRGHAQETEAEHRPDGLDLAKAARRAAGGAPGRAARKGRPAGDLPRRRTVPKASGAHPDDRDPQLLEAALERLVASHGWELDLRVQGVFGRWADLVGAEVAAHCTPESFAEGTLVVRTDSTAWATQLKLLAPQVVKRLNHDLGDGTVLRIEVLGPHLPTWKKGRYSSRDGRGPRDTYG